MKDDFPNLTTQQRHFVEYVSLGIKPREALRMAGYGKTVEPNRLMNNPHIQSALIILQGDLKMRVNMTREDVIVGLLDAEKMATNTLEKVAAWKEIGKILGVYAPDKIEVGHKHQLELNVNTIRQIPTERLIELAALEQPITLEQKSEDTWK